MGGFLLRKVGSRPDRRLLLASMLVFAGRARAAGRPGARARRREPRPRGPRGDPAQVRARPAAARAVRELGVARRAAATSAPTSASCRSRTRSSRACRSRWSSPCLAILLGVADRHLARGDRRGAARQGVRLRGDDGRARRALGAALLARAADDHPVRGQPALAAGGRLRLVRADPVAEPRAHGDAGDRARHGALGGADAADALVDARRRSAPTTSAPRARRACRSGRSSASTRSGTA